MDNNETLLIDDWNYIEKVVTLYDNYSRSDSGKKYIIKFFLSDVRKTRLDFFKYYFIFFNFDQKTKYF